MPLHRRHGLRTVALTGEGASGHRQVTHLLEGRKTVLLRPRRGPDGSTALLEHPGELILAIDQAGRSIAVLRVESVGITSLADVDPALIRADDPDADDHATWSAARREDWLAAGFSVDGDAAVTWVRFSVVGRE